jgi:hypothetical protein
MPRVEDVFGISVKPILSYVDRDGVDGKFKTALESDKHIVIYGSSKQGKTSLRTKHVKDANCAVISCGPRMEIMNIYMSMLRNAGVRIQTSETTTTDTSGSVKVKTAFKALFAFFGEGSAEAEAEGKVGLAKERAAEFIGYELSDAQAIGELLNQQAFMKYVVLENFHYLPIETQKNLAYDLKAFHEIKIRFIILGVWREANQLLVHNGDLQDRIIEIPVEPWEDSDFSEIVACGSVHLNVHISGSIMQRFIDNAYGNVGLFQEFMKAYCVLNDVMETQRTKKQLVDDAKVDDTFKTKLDDQRGQLVKVLEGIAAKSRTDGPDPMVLPYYLVKVILAVEPDQLMAGIEKNTLLQKIRELHHRRKKETIRTNDIGNLLSQLSAIQKDINPPFIYYDDNQRRLKVVDTRQFFVLANSDRSEIAEDIPFPLDLKFAGDDKIQPGLFDNMIDADWDDSAGGIEPEDQKLS